MIPRELGDMSSLEGLQLSYNSLSGSIPADLARLSNLQSLDLQSNKLSGAIPKELASLSALTYLNFNINELSGSIPPELGQMPNLAILNLYANRLTGTIPSMSGLRAIQELYLGNNQLTGALPSDLFNQTTLQVLDLEQNQLSGPFPADVTRLTNLRELVLSSNQFTGNIPPSIGTLKNLERVTLGSNQFTGTLPAEITTLPKLRGFDVGNNKLSGPIPTDLGNLTELTGIELGGNQLTGSIPRSIGRLAKLQYFSVYTNLLEGGIPAEFGNCTRLDTLFLGDNRLGGTIPDSLRNLHELVEITLGGNGLTGSMPSWIGELTKLRRIDFSYNELTGTMPSGITRLTNLVTLALNENQLSGRLPNDIGALQSLQYLQLDGNQFEGSIPASIGQLSNLVSFTVERNNLSGLLPRELGNLGSLETLSLLVNELEGSLPPELGNLKKLQSFSIYSNHFTGAIPKELGNLTALTYLDLSNNALRGAIPAEIKNLTALPDRSSDFSFNLLVTSDASVRDFVNRKQYDGDFESTQTVTPANVKVTATTDRSATLSWDLIRYTDDGGGYQVVATPAAGGAPVSIATSESKEVDSIVIRGLAASTNYSFTVSTVTHPHWAQQNLLVSDPSPAVTASTGPAVIAPADVVVVEPASGLVQVDGVPKNVDTFTLRNYGDAAASITVSRGDGDFYTISPATFTLAGGASQIVTISSTPKPAGTYYGYLAVTGDGTGADGIAIGLALLSVPKPTGTVVAEAVSTRIEVAGAPGSDSVGTAKFKNVGTAVLSGILISDQPWVQTPTDPITIGPGDTISLNFRVVRSKRPADAGALSANLSLVYVDGSSVQSLIGTDDTPPSGVSVTRVTVIDVSKPPVAPGTPSITLQGEVALFAPGIAALQKSGAFVSTDVSIVNASGAQPLRDLRLFFTPAGASGSNVATLPTIPAIQSVSLVNVVGNVYGASDSVGTLQLRSNDWRNLSTAVKLLNTKPARTSIGDVPVFRSDRSASASQVTYLTGVRGGADLYLQETAGGPSSVRIDFLDANGAAVGAPRTETLTPFGLLELRGAVPANAVTATVTSLAGFAGRIAAYARVSDETSGDTWSVIDWSRLNDYQLTEAVRIPFAEGRASSGGGGRRRAAPHATAANPTTDLTIFNPSATQVEAKVQVITASGQVSERDITVPSKKTITMSDVASPGASGHIVVAPVRGQLVVSARDYRTAAGTFGSAIPVISAGTGLRVGQSQIFADLEDSTAATVASAKPSTFRTSYGFTETSGESVTVRASVTVTQAKSVTSAVLSRTFTLSPRQQILEAELLRSMAGDARDTNFSDLHGLALQIEVTGGKGSIVPFVIITDNGSSDTIVRLE